MVVAKHEDDATGGGHARQIGVFDGITGAIHARPFPYQRPNTPSTSAPGRKPICWVPAIAVNARSSFSPG
jgi:hypothetical protein